MRSIQAFLESRVTRRALSAVLTLVMLLGLLPMSVLADLSTRSNGTVTYSRARPEAAILNRYTGTSSTFYTALKGTDTAYPQYNAVGLFGLSYDSQVKDTANHDWTGYNTSVLRDLSATSGNLEVNLSATFYNREHTHRHAKGLNSYTYTITIYEKAALLMGTGYPVRISGYDKDYMPRYPRVGDFGGEAKNEANRANTTDSYGTVRHEANPTGSGASLQFQSEPHYYYHFDDLKTCKCGGTYAENLLLTFRDTRAPKLANVYYSVDNGSTWVKRSEGLRVAGGSTLLIKLSYDEPIRFADDSANHGDLYLELQADGSSTGSDRRAYLTELNGNDLIFSYPFDANDIELEIAALNTDALFGTDLPLKQVGKDGSFALDSSLTGDDGTTGFSTTTCYITDLAGNALTKQTVNGANLTLDSEVPYVESVEFRLSLNNSDVKEALGKDDPTDKDYTDNSDLYLGAGDSITLLLHMNERLKGIEMSKIEQGTVIDWKHAVATTNIRDTNGNYVTVQSQYFYPYHARISGNTIFIMQPVTMLDGWSVDDPNGEIKVTKVEISKDESAGYGIIADQVTDQAGNALDKSSIRMKTGANANPPRLDVTAPAVTENGGYAEESDGFRYGVTIADDTSGFAGIYGSFLLSNGGDGKAYSYEWAVTAEAAATDSTVWSTGITGTAQRFLQTQDAYIHIRPLNSETYGDLSGCTLTVNARDYAGNESSITLPPSGTLAWYIDNLAPTAKAGGVSRALNRDGSGVITAEVVLTDSTGISAWEYAWGGSDGTAPTDGWQSGALNDTKSTSVTVTATGTAAEKELFSQYLWVKATDNSGKDNTSEPICLGRYTYDLRGAQYALNYSNGITAKGSLTVASLGETDALFVLVKASTADEYVLWRCYGDSANQSTIDGNLFDRMGTVGYCYTVAVDEDGIYTLTRTDDTAAAETVSAVKNGSFSGNLTVRILSGPSASSQLNENIWTLGDTTNHFEEDTITLKLAGTGDSYENIRLTTSSDLGMEPQYVQYSTDSGSYRTSLEGLQFTVSIDEDINGWNYADVDWAKSYVELTNIVTGSSTSYTFYLHPGQTASDGSTIQTLTVPAGDYETGVYNAVLHLVCFEGKDYSYTMDEDGSAARITVDTVKPNSDFSLTEIGFAANNTGYGVQKFCGTRDCLTDGVITLPVVRGQSDTADLYPFTVSSPTEKEVVQLTLNGGTSRNYRFGQYVLQMWNTAYSSNVIEITPEGSIRGTDQSTVKNAIQGGNRYGFTFDESAADNHNLYLETGKVNTVAMRKVYSNGTTSDVKYIQIQPVEDSVTGSASVDTATKELVFTPAVGTSTEGVQVYAWAWQNNRYPESGEGERVDMALSADGTWRCALLENGAQYAVVTVSASGSVRIADEVRERAPWFDSMKDSYGYVVSDRGPEGLSFTDNGDGTYELSFRVRDDYQTIQNGLTLDIGFNESYSKESLSLNLKDSREWVETGVSSTGISSVEVTKGKWDFDDGEFTVAYYADYLDVTVKGSYVPNRNGADITDSQLMQITVTATDALGNSTSISTAEQTVAYQQPKILSDSLGSKGLSLTFNQPVRPVDTWAWHDADSDVTGFRTTWDGAFPVSGNDTYELQFVDIFGNTCTQEWTTKAFDVDGKDYGIDLDFTDPDGDGKSTILTATSENGYLIFLDAADTSNALWSGDGYETIRVSGIQGNLSDVTWKKSDGDYITINGKRWLAKEYFTSSGVQERSVLWNATGKILIRNGSGSGAEGNRIFGLTVYIDDVVSAAPAADVRYYIYELGEEFTQTGLEQYIADNGGSVTVTGNVQVWYKTTRSVTPTEGGKEYLFTPENFTSGHTFAYADALGNTASVTVALPTGLTLQAPATPPEDKTAPNVDVDIYIKRSGSYTRAESFLPEDTNITEKFEDLGYVQGYSLTVNASDASGFAIAVEGDGAALNGNVVTITKTGAFTITVTDQSENKNETKVTFTVPAKIDNTPPVGVITVSATTLYEKDMTVTITDKDDAGLETENGEEDTVILSLPSGAVRTGKNTFQYYVANNGEVEFVFFDLAGNRGTTKQAVTGIDVDPPTLTVRWSPPLSYQDSTSGDWVVDESHPSVGTVNTSITARISSDKAMRSLTVQAGNETTAHDLLVDGAAQSYFIAGQDGEPLVTFTATPEQVLVTYTGNYDQPLTFTATSPNEKSSSLTLDGVGAIDKTAPKITSSQTPQTRTGYTVPYAVKVTLTPNEDVTCANYGETQTDPYTGETSPVTYWDGNPLELTFTANGIYNVRFADAAGNVTTVPVRIENIDRVAPALTVTKTEENNTVKVTVAADEACTVTVDGTGYALRENESKTISFTKNGTFAITAVDAAGNESVKMVSVGSIDDIAPTIHFTGSTIYVMEGESDWKTKLAEGVEYSDNKTAKDDLTVDIDDAEVDPTKAGQYTVIYTVTDAAGNAAKANRFVRVIGGDTVCLSVDGKLVLPESTAVLAPGSHTLALTNSTEPYTVKARKGILSAGQMKYLSGSSLSFDAGSFTVNGTGYYTLLVTTQSRQTIRILLYVEQ